MFFSQVLYLVAALFIFNIITLLAFAVSGLIGWIKDREARKAAKEKEIKRKREARYAALYRTKTDWRKVA